MNKRTFLKSSALLGLSITGLSAISNVANTLASFPADDTASGDFWAYVRSQYNLAPDYINLENGFYCIQPQEILQKYFEHIKEVNVQGAHYMRTVQAENKKAAASRLAALVGVSADELVITRIPPHHEYKLNI